MGGSTGGVEVSESGNSMRELNRTEKMLLRAYRELQAESRIITRYESIGPWGNAFHEKPIYFDHAPGWENIILSNELCGGTPRNTEIKTVWNATGIPGELSGEFRIGDLFTDLLIAPPSPTGEDPSPEDERFFASLRVVDDTPSSANEQWTAIRVTPNTDPLELWFYDPDLAGSEAIQGEVYRLELDYPEYLRNLAITKGAFSWQYLFIEEISLTSPELRDAFERLQKMLEVLPTLFPDWNYGTLTERLEARL